MFLIFSFFKLFAITSFYLVEYFILKIIKVKNKKNQIRGEVLKNAMLSLGPLYIKIGQIMATRSDIFSKEITDILQTLHDDVPPMKKNQMKKILVKSYKKPFSEIYKEIFIEFDQVPVASASIAQVHRARLFSGEVVAVKIVKHKIRDQLRINLKIIGLITRFINFTIPLIRNFNLSRRFEEIRILLVNQADMCIEKVNQRTIYNNFINHPFVKIPGLFEDYCTRDILVMEFVDGIRGKEPHLVNLSRNLLARRSQEVIYTMLFMHGFCHGDPHPGNFFYSKDGNIIPVDYGIIVELSEDEKWGLSSFIYACTRQEWSKACERLTNHFIIHKESIEKDYENYIKKITPIIKKHFNIITKNWSLIYFLKEINYVLRGFNAQYTYNFQKVVLVFLSCEGLAVLIDPDIDIWENARKFTDRYSPYMNEDVKARFDEYFNKMIPESMELRERAKKSLVAPTHLDRYVLPSTYPLFVNYAKGSRIVDVDGNTYVDLSCGYGPHILGYNHPYIHEKLEKAIKLGSVNALAHIPELELAELIVDALPSAEKVIFSNSGTESVIQALRICRGYKKRDKIAKFEGHYHGFSDQGLVSSWFRFAGSKKEPMPIAGTPGTHSEIVKNTLVLQYGDDNSLDRIMLAKDELAAVLIEPMPGSIAYYDIDFLKKLRSLCTELDIPLIFDEVVSGFRVDYSGVQGITGVDPDITCLGKIIGGGLPCGAIAGRLKYIELAKTSGDPFIDYESRMFVGGTMSGNSITCSAGKAMLTYLKEHRDIYTELNDKTKWLKERFIEISENYNIPFIMSGNHSIFSMTFNYNSGKYFREKVSGSNIKANIALAYYMRKNGSYMPELHTMFLSAVHTMEDLEIVCNSFDKSIDEMVKDNFFVF